MSMPDLFNILDLQPSATQAEVRKAYFKLAKELHPDRQVTVDPMATERFLLVQQAYEVLVDPARREEYERSRIMAKHRKSESTVPPAARDGDKIRRPKAGGKRGPTLDEERDARLAFQKAENLMDAGQFDRALRAMHVVVRTVPDKPEYLSLLGYLMARVGEKLHAARDHCRRAVEAEPYNPDFHARLGFVYTQAGLQNTADQCFGEALRLDPSNALALEWQSSGAQNAPDGLMGHLKRLLGR